MLQFTENVPDFLIRANFKLQKCSERYESKMYFRLHYYGTSTYSILMVIKYSNRIPRCLEIIPDPMYLRGKTIFLDLIDSFDVKNDSSPNQIIDE